MGRGGAVEESQVLETRSDEQHFAALAEQLSFSLTKEERDACYYYTRSVHHPVNRYLRGLSKHEETVARPWIISLDSALTKAPRINKAVTLYRGFSSKEIYKKRWRAGQIFTDPGYLSTSHSQQAILRFANEYYSRDDIPNESHRVYLEIHALAGTPLAVLGTISDNHYEDEVILPRGSRLLVKSAKRTRSGGGEIHLQLELLPTEH